MSVIISKTCLSLFFSIFLNSELKREGGFIPALWSWGFICRISKEQQDTRNFVLNS